MKRILKFLVTISVLLVIGFTVYFLTKNMSEYNINNNSGDLITDDLNNSQSGKVEINSVIEDQNENIEINNEQNQEQVKEIQSGNSENLNSNAINIFGEVKIESGDSHLINDWEPKVDAIKNVERQNKSAIPSRTLEDNVGIDILGDIDKKFLETNQITEVKATIQVAGSMVYILPDSDDLDNTQYHFDENGNLILYVRELSKYNKEGRYYFENETPIIINFDVEKKHQMSFENLDEILKRAKIVYDRYMK